MTASSPGILVPHALKRGALKPDEERYIASGSHMLRKMPVWLGMEDLSTAEILDIGCGTKFTQAILRDDIAVGRYVGIDVFKPMIEHLKSEVSDPRFSFHHMNTHNSMYNPDGEKLTGTTVLVITCT